MRKRRNKPQVIKNKEHGEYVERKVWKWYNAQGYYVRRSYMSMGAADLWVYKPRESGLVELILAQVKSHKGLLAKYEVDDLLALAKDTGGKPMHVYQVGNGRGSYIMAEEVTPELKKTATNKKRPEKGWWKHKRKKP